MKERFSCSLTGKLWWKPYLILMALFLTIFIPLNYAYMRLQSQSISPQMANASALFIIVLIILITLLQAAFTIILARIAIPTISLSGSRFSFDGEITPFVKIHLIGSILSLFPLGVYSPWYRRNSAAYCVAHTQRDGVRGAFNGKPGLLLRYLLLGLYLPLLIWFIATVTAFTKALSDINATGAVGSSTYLAAGIYCSILVLVLPYIALSIKWYMNVTWADEQISLQASSGKFCLYLLGQMLLCAITFGIYLPALYVSLWKFVTRNTALTKDGKETGRFGFDGKALSAFAILWGQILATIVTLGIYLPWASARIIRLLLEGTYINRGSAQIDDN
jgi:uncharacterized membrane protein YjgN (DUF898 family)